MRRLTPASVSAPVPAPSSAQANLKSSQSSGARPSWPGQLLRRFALPGCIATALLGCDEQKAAPTATSTTAAASVSAAPPPKPKPWFYGTWQGEYDAKHYAIEMTRKEGSVPAWTGDEGTKAAGKGKLILSIYEDGYASGDLTGPLGAMSAVGQFEDDVLSIRLRPEGEEAVVTSAFLTAKKKGEGFDGELSASSGDSLTVRSAKFSLKKSDPEPKERAEEEDPPQPPPTPASGAPSAASASPPASAAPSP